MYCKLAMDGTNFEFLSTSTSRKQYIQQGRTKSLSRASKFYSWASANGSLVIQWASKIILSCHVRDNFQSITIFKLMTAG